jgi:hypothetical protein
MICMAWAVAPWVEPMAFPRAARAVDGSGAVVGGVVVGTREPTDITGVGEDSRRRDRPHAREFAQGGGESSPRVVGTVATASVMVCFDALSCASKRRTSPAAVMGPTGHRIRAGPNFGPAKD